MDLKQVLIFGLLLVPVLTSPCHEEHELLEVTGKWLKRHLQPALDPSSRASPADSHASCPVELYRKQAPHDLEGRSLSPWRYVNRTLTDHFPPSYIEAECLCSGCILIENHLDADKRLVMTDDYVSKPLWQTKMFLKKEPCKDGRRYHLTPVYLKVAVGCTCARPNTRQSE